MTVFFFFKQKTAYEMRISDWSSDVCSSDLHTDGCGDAAAGCRACPRREAAPGAHSGACRHDGGQYCQRRKLGARHPRPRSEEHTSELQSLMRNSYAVFCLKKNKTTNKHHASYRDYLHTIDLYNNTQ